MYKQNIIFLLKLTLTVSLLVALMSFVDVTSAWEKIYNINPVWLLAALLCVLCGYVLGGLRWAWIATGLGITVSRKRKIKLYFLGMFSSLFLPSIFGGDVIRGILLAKKKGRVGMGVRAGTSVILDRLNGLYALVLLITFCMFFFSWPLLWWLIWLSLVAIMWCVMLMYPVLHGRLSSLLPAKFAKIKELPLTDKDFKRMWWRSMPLSIVLLIFMVQAHVFLGIAVGLHMSWAAYAIMIGLVGLATVLPISLNGFGIREVGYVSIAVYFGGDVNSATAMAALWVLVMGLAACPGAWVLWQLGGTASLKPYKEETLMATRLKAQHKKLLALKNSYYGRRCFIIGNGPSLKETDVSLLKDEVTIGCNGIFLMFDQMDFLPTFFTVEDTLVAEDRAEVINSMRGTTKIFPEDLQYCLKPDRDTIYINFLRPGYKGFPKFSKEFDDHVYWGGTVTFLNLQLAYYLGCSKIYLIGVDHSYRAKNEMDEQEGFTITARTPDPNHFHPDYFGPGFRYHDPKVDRMEKAYRKAKDFLGSKGIPVNNATTGGRLEVFPRVDYETLFHKEPRKIEEMG